VKTLAIVLGDQLFQGLPGIPEDVTIFMREDWGLCTRVKHHQQKIVLFLSAMRHFEHSSGRKVQYQALRADGLTYIQSLSAQIRENGIERLLAYETADPFFRSELESLSVAIDWLPNPMFMTSRYDWENYRSSKKRLLMGDFYQFQRKRLRTLVDEEGQPQGGQWSFDAENRKALPLSVLPPPVFGCDPDPITKEVIELVLKSFPNHPGDAKDFNYPVTHEEADEWLTNFLDERLAKFGDYEDAIPQRERTLFHSVLTPMLNIGLLTPSFVVERTLGYQNQVPMNSLEGFIRQVIGWREFIYWMNDEYRKRGLQQMNSLGHHRKLKECWWTGDTGLPPLDLVIKRCLKYGWAHHIERLMIAGSTMLMAEVEPHESYDWFMEMFIDSADWVMIPNVFGMSQFADGGVFATKPYISGSAYILKMSDWKKGEWCEIWDGLYWRFIYRHESLLAMNPRMSMMLSQLEKMPSEKKMRIFRKAEEWVERVTELPPSRD
jgi:deoxyribodipyrimidine photolyase-related protein